MPKRDSLLGLCSLLIKIPDYSQPLSFECHFSPGDFSEISQVVATRKPKSQETVKQPPGEVKEDQGQDALFSCPNVGCIKVYQRHRALENHLCYGKSEFLNVRETLMDKAKFLYHDQLVCEASALPFVKGVSHHCATKTEVLPQWWALRSSKKSTWFS